jgi:hypothetical protein
MLHQHASVFKGGRAAPLKTMRVGLSNARGLTGLSTCLHGANNLPREGTYNERTLTWSFINMETTSGQVSGTIAIYVSRAFE